MAQPGFDACALLGLAILVLQAFAVLLATRLEATPALVVCSVVFLGGLMSDHLFGRFAADSRIASLLWRLTPNWQHFWTADWLVAELLRAGVVEIRENKLCAT